MSTSPPGVTVPMLSEYLARVEHALAALLGDRAEGAGTGRLRLLWRRIAEAVEGGKRTRPAMLALGHAAFGGAPSGRVVDLGCAYELLHTALIVHDDVIDRDLVRRGKPTIASRYRDDAAAAGVAGVAGATSGLTATTADPAVPPGSSAGAAGHTGASVAIIAGDLLLSEALRLAHRAGAGHPEAAAIASAFHDAISGAAAGELDDVVLGAGIDEASVEDVLRMHRDKTAAYSFESPLQAGALLSGAPRELVRELGQVGRLLGIAYQIVDDVLGTFGEPLETGKSDSADLREHKVTMLIALARQVPAAQEVLMRWRAGEAGSATMRALLIELGVEARARSLAEAHCRSARDRLAALPVTAEARDALDSVMVELLRRTS